MHLRLLTLVIFTCFCIYSTNGQFENCCLSYAKVKHHTGLIKHIKFYQRQEISESCNMRAVLFYLKKRNQIICGNPEEEWVRFLIKHVDKMFSKHSNYMEHYKARNHG